MSQNSILDGWFEYQPPSPPKKEMPWRRVVAVGLLLTAAILATTQRDSLDSFVEDARHGAGSLAEAIEDKLDSFTERVAAYDRSEGDKILTPAQKNDETLKATMRREISVPRLGNAYVVFNKELPDGSIHEVSLENPAVILGDGIDDIVGINSRPIPGEEQLIKWRRTEENHDQFRVCLPEGKTLTIEDVVLGRDESMGGFDAKGTGTYRPFVPQCPVELDCSKLFRSNVATEDGCYKQ